MAITMTAVAINYSRVRLTFSTPIVRVPELSDASQYSIAPPLAILSAAADGTETSSYVDITASEQKDDQIYTITLAYDPEASSMVWKVKNVSTSTTLTSADGLRCWCAVSSASAARTITLPLISTMVPGDEIAVERNGANIVSVVRQGSDTINGANTAVLEADGDVIVFVVDSVNTRYRARVERGDPLYNRFFS